MTAYTLSAHSNIDALTAKTGGDTYDTNGFTLTIDQDSRTGLNATTSTSLGAMTVNATKGGNINIDGTLVRLIPFNTGAGNVPAWNTVISQGSASGKLIGVYSTLTVASTATGAAMPVSGFLKIKQWNSTAYASGALTGISASATGVDTVGWLEIVGDEAATINANRLGQVNITGAWYELGLTSGVSNQTVQIPNNGLLRYAPGVYIEKTVSSGNFEFYPNAGIVTTTGTDSTRGKCVWISNAGLVRIGNSGAATNGFTPVSGLRIVIGNVFLENCTTAARTANVIPSPTIATRYDFTTTGGGVVTMSKVSSAWYLSFTQPYAVTLTDVATTDSIALAECATAVTWLRVGVGNKATTDLLTSALFISLCFAGGTMTDCTWNRVSHTAAGSYTNTYTDIIGFTFVRDVTRCSLIRGHATTGSYSITRAVNCTWTTPVIVQGKMLFTTCTSCKVTDPAYVDAVSGVSLSTFAQYLYELASNTINCTFSGLTLPVASTPPVAAILLIGLGSSGIKLRSIGTRAAPLNLDAGAVDTALIYTIAGAAGASNIKIQRVYVSNTLTNIMTADNSSTGVTEENVHSDFADAPLSAVLNMSRKGVAATLALTAQTGIYGTHWMDCFTSATAGRLIVLMNEPTALTAAQVTLSGGAAFTSTGGLYMPTIGMSAIFETPYYVIGHTSFANVAATMAGGTIGNYTLEYQIDKNDGSGYSAYATMSAANLFAITGISASLGFKMRWRITTAIANTTSITSLYITTVSTTTAQDFQYPLEVVPVKVTAKAASTLAVVQDARVYLEAGAGGPLPEFTVIMNTLTNASGISQDLAFAYSADQPVTGRVRKGTTSPLYKTSPISGTITSLGLDVTSFLVGDE